MAIDRHAIAKSLTASFERAKTIEQPYQHWLLDDCIPEDCIDSINALPFEAPPLDGVSGKRELHNATRSYFDETAQDKFPVAQEFAAAFQSPEVVNTIRTATGAKVDNTYLRIEYALDVNGFWLEPHTDLGVKMFTMLLYTSREPEHADLGTDIYDTSQTPVGRSPFVANGAMVFVPSDITYHGFESREIQGVRRSVIINYVTEDWRAREQLAFPQHPIAA